jgi:hypothetical protein
MKMKTIALLVMVLVLAMGLSAQMTDADISLLDNKTDMQIRIAMDIDTAIFGALVGGVAGSLVPIGQIVSTTPSTNSTFWVETGPTTGKWITTTIPGTTSVSPNPWIVASGSVISAAISVGFYELGRQIFHWR